MNVKNKTVLLTGGSNGIGHALSKILVQGGALVMSFDITKPTEPVEGVTYLKVDITKSKQIQTAVAKIKKPISLLINNAGVMRRGDILESSEDDFDLIFNIHVKASWLILKYAQPKLMNSATILQMSSRHAFGLPPNPGLYALAKRTSYHLAKIIQKNYPGYHVKIACPGPVNTALSRYGTTKAELAEKMKMMVTPEVLAQKLFKLITSDEYSKLDFNQLKVKYEFK